jgi:hypothetical protein
MRPILIILMLLMAGATFGQLPGDFNCDGAVIDSDIDFIQLYLFTDWCGNLWECSIENGDYYPDGIPLTVADLFGIYYLFANLDEPDFPNNPESDTIIISSTTASPGDILNLPIFIKTVDFLTAVQIYVKADPNYITLDSVLFVARPDLCNHAPRCESDFHLLTFPVELPRYVSFPPGTYHYADLFITVNDNIDQEVVTWIEASFDPEYALNTGFANLEFFTPVLVNGEINITPTGIGDDNSVKNLPILFSVDSYPNPFNASAKITYSLPVQAQVTLDIYDILGRRIETLVNQSQAPGSYQALWDAADIPSGIYFYRLAADEFEDTGKMVLMK